MGAAAFQKPMEAKPEQLWLHMAHRIVGPHFRVRALRGRTPMQFSAKLFRFLQRFAVSCISWKRGDSAKVCSFLQTPALGGSVSLGPSLQVQLDIGKHLTDAEGAEQESETSEDSKRQDLSLVFPHLPVVNKFCIFDLVKVTD